MLVGNLRAFARPISKRCMFGLVGAKCSRLLCQGGTSSTVEMYDSKNFSGACVTGDSFVLSAGRSRIGSAHAPKGQWICRHCGWAYPNAHPSAKNRRKHKKICSIAASHAGPGGSSDEASSDEEKSCGNGELPFILGRIACRKVVLLVCISLRHNYSFEKGFLGQSLRSP